MTTTVLWISARTELLISRQERLEQPSTRTTTCPQTMHLQLTGDTCMMDSPLRTTCIDRKTTKRYCLQLRSRHRNVQSPQILSPRVLNHATGVEAKLIPEVRFHKASTLEAKRLLPQRTRPTSMIECTDRTLRQSKWTNGKNKWILFDGTMALDQQIDTGFRIRLPFTSVQCLLAAMLLSKAPLAHKTQRISL